MGLHIDSTRLCRATLHPMALSLNKPKLDNLAGDIWKSAERLCGKFKAGPYERSENRRGYANGFKPKTLHARMGTMSFSVAPH